MGAEDVDGLEAAVVGGLTREDGSSMCAEARPSQPPDEVERAINHVQFLMPINSSSKPS